MLAISVSFLMTECYIIHERMLGNPAGSITESQSVLNNQKKIPNKWQSAAIKLQIKLKSEFYHSARDPSKKNPT